jgi:hypothetical protein
VCEDTGNILWYQMTIQSIFILFSEAF